MNKVLLLSPRHTPDSQLIWSAAVKNEHYDIYRYKSLTDYHPEWMTRKINQGVPVTFYGETLFCRKIAGELGITLQELPNDWLKQLPRELLNRQLQYGSVALCEFLKYPCFIKPANDKHFPAQVWESYEQLKPFLPDFDIDVLASEPVRWEVEYRCFVNKGRLVDMSIYMKNHKFADVSDDGNDMEAASFVQGVLAITGVQMPTVIDIGKIEGRGWAVVEANPAWCSGIYNCDPDKVLNVIEDICATVGLST